MSAVLPPFYHTVFCLYEPFILTFRFFNTLIDPLQAYTRFSPTLPALPLPRATTTTLIQHAHFGLLFALSNLIFLRAVPRLLVAHPAREMVEEAFVAPYVAVLLIGDIVRVGSVLWGWGWPGAAASTGMKEGTGTGVALLAVELTLLVPRLAWVLGLGRYVHHRDAPESVEKEKRKGL